MIYMESWSLVEQYQWRKKQKKTKIKNPYEIKEKINYTNIDF